MAIDSMTAARAYLDTARTLSNTDNTSKAQGTPGAPFGQMVGQALSTAEGAGQSVETAMVQAASGKADLVDVVTAVAAAEATLETVVSVRDQVIKAYQDILRMPI